MRTLWVIPLLLLVVVLPAIASADGTGIWKGTSCAEGSGTGGPITSCTFCDAIIVAHNIIGWIVTVAFGIATLMIVVGAVQFIVSGGSEENISKGKKTMTNALIGIVIILASWLVLTRVLNFFVKSGSLVSLTSWTDITCNNP